MTRDLGTTLERQKPSGELRQFLDPLNPGLYFDHGPARLYGIDEVLELEAKRRGRRLGEDEFQLVATDGGLIFCRASICFAIAARWRDLALHRPGKRHDESGRVELPVDWPSHGQLTFTVSPRLGSNVYRRWLHLREQDEKRAQMSGESGLEVARHTDPNNPVTVVLDDDAKLAIMGELAPEDITASEIIVDHEVDNSKMAGHEGDEDDEAEVDITSAQVDLDLASENENGASTPEVDSWPMQSTGQWTEPGLELTGGETLFVVPARGERERLSPASALSTIDPGGLALSLDAAFQRQVTSTDDNHPTDLMPSLDGLDVSREPDVDEVDSVGSIRSTNSEPDLDLTTDDEREVTESDRLERSDAVSDDTEIDPNQTVDQREIDADDLFNPEQHDSLSAIDDDIEDSGVFSVERPVVPSAPSTDGVPGSTPSAPSNEAGVRDSDMGIGSFERPDDAELGGSRGSSYFKSNRSKSAPFAGGISGSAGDGDTTLAEVWHRNKVSILAGVSLIVLLVVALSSLLNGDDDGGEVEAGGDSEITIPERSGSISLPTEDPAESSTTTEPRAPLIIEGLTTAGSGEGTTGVGQSSSTEPADSAESQAGDVAICHSNYGGCVPVAADVDCVGDGDGPAFLSEPVVVFGEDVYDLDTDDDREACELGQPLNTPPDG